MTPKWINSRYQIVASLGSGGSSKVFRAIDRKDKNESTVAVKLLGQLPDKEQEIQLEFFTREVRALSTLSHPRIIRLLDSGYDADNQLLYVVLEYVEHAASLRERLKTWKPSLLDTIDFALDILDGIGYAHQAHVIHRDVNPGNILVDGTGNIKIIDFGVAKILGTLTAGQTVGDFFTRPYASPEQVAHREFDYSTDIYSLAAVIYFMLARHDPASSTLLSDQFKNLPGLTTEALSVFQGMAAVDPSERYSSAHQVLLALRSARQGLEAKTNKYAVLLTMNVLKNFYEQTVINSQNFAEAQRVIQTAFLSGVYVRTDTESTVADQYDLISDSISLRCIIEKHGGKFTNFVARSAETRLSPHKLEGIKQHGYSLHAQWYIGMVGTPVPSDVTPLDGLSDEVENFARRKLIEQNVRERRTDLVESWMNILSLDRELKQESLLQIDYSSWAAVENNTVIKVKLQRDVNVDELITPGALLVMPSKRDINMLVGHYIRQDSNTILISKTVECKLDLISSAGKVSVDERQWAAAWKRQRYALYTVVNARCTNPKLPDILLDPKQAEQSTEEVISTYFNEKLDNEKKQVVSQALCTKDLYLIQGPPGTGKTLIISEIVAQILTRNPKSRILLVSQSNVAVDHVLAKVGQLRPGVRMIRIGREDQIAPGAAKYFLDRKLKEWGERVRGKCEEYLEHNRTNSEERSDVQCFLDILHEMQSKIASRSDLSQNGEDKDLEDGLQILRERYPDLKIEPTVGSLKKVEEELRKEIHNLKSNLELTIEDWLKRLRSLDEFEDAYFEACSVVAGTCVGVVGKRNLPERFDWAIIDEAGRATPSEILIPMVRAERNILVGDHRQLPPVIEYGIQKAATGRMDIDPVWLKTSLFAFLFANLEPNLKAVIRIQYRMHPHIANLIGRVFYPEENLETGISPDAKEHGWRKWSTAVVWYSTSNLENRYEGTTTDGSRYNLCEVSVIESQLMELEKDLSDRKDRKSIAVIAGYKAQTEQLSLRLEPDNKKRWKNLNIEINTVDAFQGREEDIVFYSVVRSNKSKEIGFLKDCRRLNVALSRACELLFIVGDHYMAAHADTHPDPNPFKEVITYIVGHPAECTLAEVPNGNR